MSDTYWIVFVYTKVQLLASRNRLITVSYVTYIQVHCLNSLNFGVKGKGKAIPLQALTGPESSRRLRLPYFKTIGT
jgi:hypothetical protein